MNRAVVRGYTAPHKPILLLSILSLIEEGKISSNKIYLTEDLIAKFSWMWSLYVDDGAGSAPMMVADGLVLEIKKKYPFKCSIANPFYHMNHEPYWKLVPSENYIKKQDYSVKGLQTCFLYAELSLNLYDLMRDEQEREKMRTLLKSII